MTPNVQQAVPFFMVADLELALRFYVAGLGFTLIKRWAPEGKLRWCWLELDGVALMLQQYPPTLRPPGTPGQGVSLCFQCHDALALYHAFLARGLQPQQPFVGNALWVVNLEDPDGYRLSFQSPSDAPEESLYPESGRS